MNFTRRSYQKELLDGDNIPFEDIARNMKELEIINRFLGGHRINVQGLQQLLPELRVSPVRICEIGSGGGDNLRALESWCRNNKIPASFTGIDINRNCIEYAKQASPPNFTYIENDYSKVSFDTKPDILFCSLFCHHFNNEEIVELIHWMNFNASLGFFINDLHRHPLAYYSIKLLTSFFSKSYLVKNDAPLSVLRGFKERELITCLEQAAVQQFSVEWKWAFRWLVTVNQSGSSMKSYRKKQL